MDKINYDTEKAIAMQREKARLIDLRNKAR